jgi:hypothetical protein
MNKWITILVISLLVSACGASVKTDLTAEKTPSDRVQAPTPKPLPSDLRVIIKSSSVSLIVDDPTEALSMMEQAVQDAGGDIMSASSYTYPESGTYANLNAKVPPDKLVELRQAAHELASQVVSDSIYNTDVTKEYKLAHEKLARLNLAEKHLWELITTSKEPEMVESLTLLRELLKTDIENVENELLRYEQDSQRANFDITLTESIEPQIFLE